MIIAIKEKDRVVIGYSNVDCWSKLTDSDYIDEENVAIRFADNGTAYAFAKMDCSSDMFLYDDEFLDQDVTQKSIIKEVIPYIKEKLNKNNKLMEDNSWGNGLIICKDNRIYDINPQFIMREIDDYACHGFNVDVLQSVLDSTVGLPAEERILKAVKFTGQLYKEDMFPLIIADTSTKQFKFIMKEDN